MVKRARIPHGANRRLALTYREAGESLGVSERTIWTLVREGYLPAVRIGRSVRIPVASLQRYLARLEVAQ